MGTIIVALFALAMVAVGLRRAYLSYRNWIGLRILAKRTDSMYIVSQHPETGARVDLPGYESLIVYAPYRAVLQTAEAAEEMFVESRNGLYEAGEIGVVTFIFREGEFVAESWQQFTERVRDGIDQDRTNKHQGWRKKNREWYLTEVCKQTYTWQKN